MPELRFPVHTALITGASAGIGEEFARQLAAAGVHMILVARRKDKLDSLASELGGRFKVSVDVMPADLSITEDVERVAKRVSEVGTLDLLVNNAGFGETGKFAEGDSAAQLRMVQVHISAAVCLTRAALAGMVSRRRGRIINVASVAAFTPVSGPMYGGTKAFLVRFSENLQYELAGQGIRIQALCPGMTHTEFHDVMGMDESAIPRFMWMSASRVVRVSLKALGRRKVICVPGGKNRLIVALMRFAPTGALVKAISKLPYFRRKAAR